MNSNKEISWFEQRKEQIEKELQSHPLYIELATIDKALSYYHQSNKDSITPKQSTPSLKREQAGRTLRELILDEFKKGNSSKSEIVSRLMSQFPLKSIKQLNNVIGPKLSEMIHTTKEIVIVEERAPTKGGNIYGLPK